MTAFRTNPPIYHLQRSHAARFSRTRNPHPLRPTSRTKLPGGSVAASRPLTRSRTVLAPAAVSARSGNGVCVVR